MTGVFHKPFALLKVFLGQTYFHIRSYKYEYLHQNLKHSVQLESHRIWNDPQDTGTQISVAHNYPEYELFTKCDMQYKCNTVYHTSISIFDIKKVVRAGEVNY